MKKTDGSLAKGLRVLKALRGNALSGVTNQQIALSTGLHPSAVSRIMQTLIDEGLAVRLDSGTFAHSVLFLQIAQQFANEMSSAQSRLDELKQRVHAGARQ